MPYNTNTSFPPGGAPVYRIDKEWCMGDSLGYLNANFQNLDTRVDTISTTYAANLNTQITAVSGVPVARLLDGNQIGSAPIFGARAWVKFNGTSTGSNAAQTIIGQGNVASVTRIGTTTGSFLITFAIPLPNVNYAAIGNYNELNTGTGSDNDGQATCYDHQTTSVKIFVMNGGANAKNPITCSVVAFG